MKIADGKIVSIAYSLKGDDDALIDSADAKDPLDYLHGPNSGLIPALLTELEGKAAGDHVTVSLTPEAGYGVRDDSKIRRLPLRRFGKKNVTVGSRMTVDLGDHVEAVMVLAIQGDYVTVDPNHPLAGKNLKFEIDVVNVRDATSEELEHGHAHSAGDHHH